MENSQRLKLVLVLFSLLLKTPGAFAWGGMGHQVIGEIAERNLTPNARQSILNILGPEPLAISATWPDDIRDDQDFKDFGDYHFVEVKTGDDFAKIPPEHMPVRSAYTVMAKYPNLIKNPSTPRSVKMVALKYLIHVIGDLHQPLHVGNDVDAGGNLCRVYLSPGSRDTNLHSIWDTLFVNDDVERFKKSRTPPVKFYSYVHYADDILQALNLNPGQVKNAQTTDVFAWIRDAQDLRKYVYPDDASHGPVNDQNRPYCGKKNEQRRSPLDPSVIPVLSEAYKANATTVIEAQLVRGGLRAAAYLNALFATPISPGPNTALTKQQIIDALDLTNN